VRYLTALGRLLRTASLIVGNTVILIVLGLLIGEWWARSVMPPMPPEAKAITVQNQHAAYHPWAGFRNTPGFRYDLGNYWVPVVVNSWGWRGPEPTIARSKSVKRAILLGDSVAYSCWGCREEASLGGILKRALEVRTGEEWEVINASVPAGFSSISLGTLAHDGMQFQPDVVTTLNGINDILVLDERTMLKTGVGLFKHSIYHTTQLEMARIFDPRTGAVRQPEILDEVFGKSALFRVLSNSSWFAPLRAHASAQAQPDASPPASSGYSTDRPERLDIFVNNQLAMSYLAEGSGAKFVGALSPYLSLKHKVLGDDDKAAVKAQDPALLTWLDDVVPILRAKLQKAASEHTSFNFVDLSLMFTHEQVFADIAHVKYESFEKSTGYDMVAARMADEIVRVLYAGKNLPNWRENYIEGTPHDWNEQAYLAANLDVSALIAEGKFENGFDHYRSMGFLEFRHSGFPSWNEQAYLEENPDLLPLIQQGLFATGYEHYIKQGKAEGRRRGLPLRWIEETYLAANPDAAADVAAGKFKSGEEHFMKIGAREKRKGGFSGWDEEGYLIPYGDVRIAVAEKRFRSGIEHYLLAGAREKRQIALGLTSFR
jgi:hypothetical protein